MLLKDCHDKLFDKENNIDTSGLVLKSRYDTDKSELERKIPDLADLLRN